jgi:hypothetical protein
MSGLRGSHIHMTASECQIYAFSLNDVDLAYYAAAKWSRLFFTSHNLI